MPSGGTKIKETVLVSILNIALPSFDVYTDLALIRKFFKGSPSNQYCDEKYPCCLLPYDCSFGDECEPGTIDNRSRCYSEEVPKDELTYTPQLAWGTMMLVPFMLNYLLCWYAWATTDKRKAFTWVAALLSFYPQFVACKIIWQIWNNPKKGLQKKRYLERELIQSEIFCEVRLSQLASSLRCVHVHVHKRNIFKKVVLEARIL